MQQRTMVVGATPALALLGGILVTVGSIMNWAKASAGPFSASAQGLDGWEGKVTIFGGLLMLVAGISAFTRASGARNRLRVTALIGGVAAAGVGLYTALTAKDQVIEGAASEIAKELGVPVAQARAAVQQAIDNGLLKVSLEIGIYMVIVGGVIGIVAAILAMRFSEPAPAMPGTAGVPAPGAGLTGWSAPAAPQAPASSDASPWATPLPSADVPPNPAPPVEGSGEASGETQRDEGTPPP